MTMPIYETALRANTAPGLNKAISKPATAGPTDWAMLRDTESRPIAWGKFSASTISGVSAINAGAEIVNATDSRNVPTKSQFTDR
ncbi:MAG: hypothetical protein QNL84_00180 [Acidimicrobiia bacterium]